MNSQTLLIEIGTIAAALVAIISLVVTVQKALAPLKDIKTATAVALEYSIARAHREYMTDGRIGRYALSCIDKMQGAYKKLGGNGFVDELVKELRSLPMDI